MRNDGEVLRRPRQATDRGVAPGSGRGTSARRDGAARTAAASVFQKWCGRGARQVWIAGVASAARRQRGGGERAGRRKYGGGKRVLRGQRRGGERQAGREPRGGERSKERARGR